MSKKKTSVTLNRATHRKLKQEAKRQRRTMSCLVEITLEREFGNGEVAILPQRPEVEVAV